MSLSFDYRKVVDSGKVMFHAAQEDGPDYIVGDLIMRNDVRDIIFSMPALGIAEITTKNVDELHFRLTLWTRYRGLPDQSYELLQSLIGLKVNAAPETRAKWLKRMTDNWAKELTWTRRHAREEQHNATQ